MKDFGRIRLESNGEHWRVWEKIGFEWLIAGMFRKMYRESDEKLIKRVKNLLNLRS